MPSEVFDSNYKYLDREEILTFEEIDKLVASLVPLGVEKIRLTGGEPLVRRDFTKLVKMLSRHDVELAMTTNGVLLEKFASELATSGLDRVTVSLDALDDETFKMMTDSDVPVSKILTGIDAAREVGLGPIKVNTVVRRGMNEHAILDIVNHFRGSGVIVRFIEFMDVGASNGWRMDEVVTAEEIRKTLSSEYQLSEIPPKDASAVAKVWETQYGDKIGFITSISKPFCGDCTRGRISSEGKFYNCLFASTGVELKDVLRAGASEADVQELVTEIWDARSDRYSELRGEEMVSGSIRLPVEMSHIGG